MAKYSNYSALDDLIKLFNSELMMFNSDLVVSFSLLLFVVFANSSRPLLSRYIGVCGAQFENHRSRLWQRQQDVPKRL